MIFQLLRRPQNLYRNLVGVRTSLLYFIAFGLTNSQDLDDFFLSMQISISKKLYEPDDTLESILKSSPSHQENNHLAQWVRNSHRAPPPDHEIALEEWTAEELAARAPRESSTNAQVHESTEEHTAPSSDPEQQSTTSSASLSTVKSSSVNPKKNGNIFAKETPGGSINICRRCHRWSLSCYG